MVKSFMDFLSTVEPIPPSDQVIITSVPPIVIEEEPNSEVPAEDAALINADVPTRDPADVAPNNETSVPVEIEPCTFVHSPPTKEDSIFELAEDPAPKRRRLAEDEVPPSPRLTTPPFRPVLKAKKREITAKDSTIEDFNVAVGIARG